MNKKKITGALVMAIVLAGLGFIYLDSTSKNNVSSSEDDVSGNIKSIQVTFQKLGSFPCYYKVTTVIQEDGAVTSTGVPNPFPPCVDQSTLKPVTDAYKLEPAQLTAIKAKLKQTNVFSFKDSYIDEKMLDYAGDRWGFIIDGQQKEIEVRVASSNDLPRELGELLDFIRKTTFSGRYPL